MLRTYSELIKLKTFNERYEYLRLKGDVGVETFGRDRYLNQVFYNTPSWRKFRRSIVLREQGRDLGAPHCEFGPNEIVVIHHMNPITLDDLLNNPELLMNPEYVIATSLKTHNAIHYGKEMSPSMDVIERHPNDTIPWRL